MEIEILGKTTLWTIERESASINSIVHQRDTDYLRIILHRDLAPNEIEQLIDNANLFPKVTVVIGNCKTKIWDFLHQFKTLIGLQKYSIDSESMSLIDNIPSGIKELEMGFSSVPKNGLEIFDRFTALESLSISGKFKGINNLSLSNLKSLCLYYVSEIDLCNLNQMSKLSEIQIHHGSVINVKNWSNFPDLTKLVIWKTRGLDSLDWLKEIKTLECLEIGALANINHFPELKHSLKLERLKIEQLKNLDDITNVAIIESLKYLHLVQMNQIPLEDFNAFVNHKRLTQITSGYSSKKKQSAIRDLLGLEQVQYKPIWEE